MGGTQHHWGGPGYKDTLQLEREKADADSAEQKRHSRTQQRMDALNESYPLRKGPSVHHHSRADEGGTTAGCLCISDEEARLSPALQAQCRQMRAVSGRSGRSGRSGNSSSSSSSTSTSTRITAKPTR
jgi:hypothetical protein